MRLWRAAPSSQSHAATASSSRACRCGWRGFLRLRLAVLLAEMLGAQPAPRAGFAAPLGMTRHVPRLGQFALAPLAIMPRAIPLRLDFLLTPGRFACSFVGHSF